MSSSNLSPVKPELDSLRMFTFLDKLPSYVQRIPTFLSFKLTGV